MPELATFEESQETRGWTNWSETLFCRTLINTPNDTFEIDLSKKSDPPCPGANYVCFGYALLFYDPIPDAIRMTNEIVNLSLDELPWKFKKCEYVIPLKRLSTMGVLYGNPDRRDQAVRSVSKHLDVIMARTLRDITISIGDCRNQNFISNDAYERALRQD